MTSFDREVTLRDGTRWGLRWVSAGAAGARGEMDYLPESQPPSIHAGRIGGAKHRIALMDPKGHHGPDLGNATDAELTDLLETFLGARG